MQTIYALSTVYGKSGVAIIRISGENALQVVEKMTNIKNPTPRYAYFTNITSCTSTNHLDKALLVYFNAPHSFTGEDVVELHIHGSKAVISSVLDNLSQLPDFRLAECGEFSKRAFYNNKMDLTEAEGLADLIDAETSEQQKYALRQMEGNLKNVYEGWREDIIKILAHLEAYIDFPDEEIPESIKNNMLDDTSELKKAISKHLSSDNIGERLREGFRVAIVGPPNAGKSSLINTIAKREAVIVSEIAGTTRDAIDIHLDLKGYPVIFTDTAGLREAEEEIEKKGIEIAHQKIASADLILCLFDASTDTPQLFEKIQENIKDKAIYVANKSDLSPSPLFPPLILREGRGEEYKIIPISAKYNQGIDVLLETIYQKIQDRFTSSSNLLITRQRYREALNEAVENLNSFSLDKEIELSAEDIRLVARALGKITGRIEVDDILNKIFSDFCIGK